MLGIAARAMGYRIVALDPDPACPTAAVADEIVVGAYDDPDAARRLARMSDVVTYELEHVGLDAAAAAGEVAPLRPGLASLQATRDRLAERRFIREIGEWAAPWREVRDVDDARAAADALGYPVRLKTSIGGYDGRSQVRVTAPARGRGQPCVRWAARRSARCSWRRRSTSRPSSPSSAPATANGRSLSFPVSRNVHDAGILVESVAPAPVHPLVAADAREIADSLVRGLDLVGLLTVELFQLRGGGLMINELAPRVHNSGHWTIEGAVTSQFEQHLRAILGLPLGSVRPYGEAAMVNLLGTGADRPARLAGLERALADPAVHVHLYGKRRVFERRKMGHVTVVGGRRRRGAGAGARRTRRTWLGGLRVSEASPVVGIVGGSRSDFPCLEKASMTLEQLGIPCELRVVSAHRTPDHLFRYAETARDRGIRVIIAGAGGAAHLPGMLAAKTTLPVIGVPVPTEHLGGLDSLLSIVQMPRGIPVATVAIGNAENAALLAAQILALSDPELAARVEARRDAQTEAVLTDPSNAESLPG